MQNFTLYSPTEIVFGKDAESKTGVEIKKWGGSKVLIVYGGGSVVRSGLLKRVEEKVDFVLAIGGGSSIDTAKAITHGVARPECKLWDLWMKNFLSI